MRIALLCDEYPPRRHGGIGTFTRTYARGLAAAGHDVSVLGVAEHDAVRGQDGVRVIDVGRTRLRGIAWWRDRRQLRERLLAERCDVVETPDYGGLVPWGAGGAPVVMRVHGSATWCATFGARAAGRRLRWCERATARSAAAWIHPTEHALDGAQRVLADAGHADVPPSTLVPHCVPDANEPTAPIHAAAGRMLLFAGSLYAHRGVLAAAHAARRVMEALSDVHFVVVGEDTIIDGRAASRRVLEAVGADLAQRVHLTGRVAHAEVAAWMRAADVFLHPSAHEAFGLVLLEAAREGLPIVSSARGAAAEVLRAGETALLAPPGDAEALAACTLRLLADHDLARRLAARAGDDVRDRFSVARCVADSVAVYERIAR